MLQIHKPEPRGLRKVKQYVLTHLGWFVITVAIIFREEIRGLLGLR